MTDWTDHATMTLPRGRDGESTRELVSPIDGRAFATVAEHGAADVDSAVQRARTAFEDGRWARRTPAERKAVMLRWAELVERDLDQIARMDTQCMGMPRMLSTGYCVPWLVNALRYYGEALDKIEDAVAPTGDPVLALVTREPAGVVGVVLPWNWPTGLAGWKLGPAIASGCSVVAKPDEKTPLSLLHVAALAVEAGLPEGVLEVVTGGPKAGESIGRHRDIDVLTFTGSGEVGRLFQRYAGESNGKTVWLELGGKGPNIIFPDAPDLAAAAQAAAFAIFMNSGQVCAAGSRLIVHRSVKDEVVEIVGAVARQLAPADPRHPETVIGSMSSAEHLARVERYLEIAAAEGAMLAVGGGRALEETGGSYLVPTILDNVDPKARVAQEEIFGPVVAVIPFDHEEEAIAIANDTPYGLAGGLWTRDLNTAIRVSRRLRMGSVGVNNYGEDAHSVLVPFGGYKASGYGRDKSLHAMEKYQQLKTTWIKLQ